MIYRLIFLEKKHHFYCVSSLYREKSDGKEKSRQKQSKKIKKTQKRSKNSSCSKKKKRQSHRLSDLRKLFGCQYLASNVARVNEQRI